MTTNERRWWVSIAVVAVVANAAVLALALHAVSSLSCNFGGGGDSLTVLYASVICTAAAVAVLATLARFGCVLVGLLTLAQLVLAVGLWASVGATNVFRCPFTF